MTLRVIYSHIDPHGNIFLDLASGPSHIGSLCIVPDTANGGYTLSGDAPDCWADDALRAWIGDVDADDDVESDEANARMDQIWDIVLGVAKIEGVE